MHATIEKLHQTIATMAEADELAAVIVHLNDTYLIEARESRIPGMMPLPGMARIATFVDGIRERVKGVLGEDLTLVVHSGDFVMPSRLGLLMRGMPMTSTLAKFVDYAALGNHEFDLGAEALDRLIRGPVDEGERGASGQLRVVCTNVSFPTSRGFPALKTERAVLWPEKDPLFAIVGVMGAKTCPKKADFVAPEKAIEEVRASGELDGALRLLVLSHDDRDRDVALLDALDAETVTGPSFVYLLGGHDHQMNWSEMSARGPKGSAVFSKCLSNGRSLRIFLVSRSQLAVDQARRLKHWDSMTRANVMANLSRRYLGSKGAYFSDLVAQAKDWKSFYSSVDPSRLMGDVFVRLGADALWTVEPAAHHLAWTARLTAARPPTKVLIERTSLIDARDKSTRGGPTSLGTFVAQCVRAGMKADVAIIHAGSFRGDDHFGPNLDTHMLEDIFVYDGKPTEWAREDGSTVLVRPIVRIPLHRDAVRALLAHGRGKRDDGGYVHVSESEEREQALLDKNETLEVALPSYLVCDRKDQDGFRAIVERFMSAEDLEKAIASRVDAARTIGELVIANAGDFAKALDMVTANASEDDAEWIAESFCSNCGVIVDWFAAKPSLSVYHSVHSVLYAEPTPAWLNWTEFDRLGTVLAGKDPDLANLCMGLKDWLVSTLDRLRAKKGDEAAALAAARARLPPVEGEILEALLFVAYFNYPANPPGSLPASPV